MAGNYTRLSGLPFRNFIQEKFTVTHHGVGSLPALLYPSGLWDLEEMQNIVLNDTPVSLVSMGSDARVRDAVLRM